MSLYSQVVPGVSQRSDFSLVGKRCALLVIDIQAYLSVPSPDERDDYLYSQALPITINNIQKLVQAFRVVRDDDNNVSSQNVSPKRKKSSKIAVSSSIPDIPNLESTDDTNGSTSSKSTVKTMRPVTTSCEVIFTYLQSQTKDNRDISLDYKLSGPSLANIPNASTPLHKIFLKSLMPDVETGNGDILLPKTSCNVFASTNIDYLLRNLQVEQLVIVGQLTNQCVESAVREAADRGYFVTVVHDACAAKSAQEHYRGLENMQGFARIMSASDVLTEIVQDLATSLRPSTVGIAKGPEIDDAQVVMYLQRRGMLEEAQRMSNLFQQREKNENITWFRSMSNGKKTTAVNAMGLSNKVAELALAASKDLQDDKSRDSDMLIEGDDEEAQEQQKVLKVPKNVTIPSTDGSDLLEEDVLVDHKDNGQETSKKVTSKAENEKNNRSGSIITAV